MIWQRGSLTFGLCGPEKEQHLVLPQKYRKAEDYTKLINLENELATLVKLLSQPSGSRTNTSSV